MNKNKYEILECQVSVELCKSFRLLVPKGLSKTELEELINKNLNCNHIIHNGNYSESRLKLDEIYGRSDKNLNDYDYCLKSEV